MVISYSKQELNAIGEMVIIKECISRMHPSRQQQEGSESPDQQPTQPIITNNPATTTIIPPPPPPNNYNFQLEFFQFQQQLQQQLGHQIPINLELPDSQEPLTSSVADFFRKAQQNFYAQTSIDPTKVRRLSEVEAELIDGSRRDSR